MANIVIVVGSINQAAAPAGQYRVTGVGEVAGAGTNQTFGWEAFVNFSDTPVQVNAAVKDAAVAAAVAAGFTVGPSDNKTMFGSANLV